MRKMMTSVIFVILTSSTLAPAQAAGKHNGLIVGLYSLLPLPGTSTVLHVLPNGSEQVFATTPAGPWTFWSYPASHVMDVDNRTLLVPAFLDAFSSRFALLQWDPQVSAVVGTLWSGPIGRSLSSWSNWTIDSDGNPVTIDRKLLPPRLTTFDRLSRAWSSIALPLEATGWGGLVWDKARGGFVHASQGPQSQTVRAHLYRTSPAGVTTTLAIGRRYVGLGGDLSGSGDWNSSIWGTTGMYFVPDGFSSFIRTGSASPLYGFDDVTHGKWAAPGDGFYGYQHDVGPLYPGGVYYVDPNANPPAQAVWLAGGRPSPPVSLADIGHEVSPLYERDLATLRSGKGTWNVLIRPGSAHAGRMYQLAASLTGARPPIVLPDGRELFLRPDPLTNAVLAGATAPFLTGTVGMLDARGEGAARLDLSAFGQTLNGLTIHFCGAILDPAAPSGIAWVLDPWAFAVNVRP